MSSLNKKVRVDNFTHEGGKASNITLDQQLRRSVMSCMLWERDGYEDGISIANRIEELVKELNVDVVSKIAIEAKTQMKLRHIPLFLAILLIENGHNVRKLIPQIVNRVDDMGELLAIYRRNDPNKSFSRSLFKRYWRLF